MAKTAPFDKHTEDYENWFVVNEPVFKSELGAIQRALTDTGKATEVGIGTGIFAAPLGIKEGIDPSGPMLGKAKERGISAIHGVAEDLPYPDESKDSILMVTTVCFLDDIYKSFREVHRVLKKHGHFIIGFVDKNSLMGNFYVRHKHENVFYKDATFYETEEIYRVLNDTGFRINNTYQTVFGKAEDIKEAQETMVGYGYGSFVVTRAGKRECM